MALRARLVREHALSLPEDDPERARLLKSSAETSRLVKMSRSRRNGPSHGEEVIDD